MRTVVQMAAIGGLVTGAFGWSVAGLPLTIVVADGGQATAHLEFLGEYPNDIKVVELEQLTTSQVVWRVVADKELVQLHQIPLVVGRNTAGLRTSWGQARTEVPGNLSEFVLMPDTDYRLRVCPSAWWRRCASEVFRFRA